MLTLRLIIKHHIAWLTKRYMFIHIHQESQSWWIYQMKSYPLNDSKDIYPIKHPVMIKQTWLCSWKSWIIIWKKFNTSNLKSTTTPRIDSTTIQLKSNADNALKKHRYRPLESQMQISSKSFAWFTNNDKDFYNLFNSRWTWD
jgi:hypothetical protein